MSHSIFGFAALLATLTILLVTWEAPRWAIRAFCICALSGATVFALSRPGPITPAVDGPVTIRTMAPGPAVDAPWDARDPHRSGSVW